MRDALGDLHRFKLCIARVIKNQQGRTGMADNKNIADNQKYAANAVFGFSLAPHEEQRTEIMMRELHRYPVMVQV